MPLNLEGAESNVAALTVVKRLLDLLTAKGVITPEEYLAIVDQAIRFHENTEPGGFSEENEMVALLLREAFHLDT